MLSLVKFAYLLTDLIMNSSPFIDQILVASLKITQCFQLEHIRSTKQLDCSTS